MPVARNEPCPCGSGAKYKKCCLGIEEALEARQRQKIIRGALVLVIATALTFFLAGPGVGSAVGLGLFGVAVGYMLVADGPDATKAVEKAAEKNEKRKGRKAA
jgi:small neutral amino acid transporter SnatA (MarC family)